MLRISSTAVRDGIERAEVLIEVALAQVRAAPDCAPSIFGGAAPAKSFSSVVLPGAVGPHDADAIAATHQEIDALEQLRSAARCPEPLRVEDDVARCAERARSESAPSRRPPTRPRGARPRSSLSSILRRLCACFVFCPAMFLRMKSSVLSTKACCRSTSSRSRARSASRATAYSRVARADRRGSSCARAPSSRR